MRSIKMQTPLECSPKTAWEALQRRALLDYVTHPLLKIMPLELEALPERMEQARYPLKLYLFGFIPLGQHTICVTKIDAQQYTIETEESSTLLKQWRHRLTLRSDTRGQTLYSDTLSFEAGPLTPLLWPLVYTFYRYRQARWRGLARRLGAAGQG